MPDNKSTEQQENESRSVRSFPATIARVLDPFTVVINRGSEDGLKQGRPFLIYFIGNEVIDPETQESLGYLEVVRGRGVVTHLQERMATIRSSSKRPSKTVRTKNLGLMNFGTEVVEETGTDEILPFQDPEVGDKAKPL